MEVLLLYKSYFLSAILFICLIYPIYRFIFIINARRLNRKDFDKMKEKIKKKSLRFSIIITLFFTLFYGLKFF